ncbi:MAG TPA: hypothetical protein VID03_01220 [Acidimicrobiia bacterium]|jgi:hypothetical protein
MRRLIIGAATVGALVTGGVVGAAVAAPAPRVGQTEETTTTTPATAKHDREGVIAETLDQLAEDGVITQDQADVVLQALTDALADEVRAHPFRRGLGLGFRLGTLLDDGVITAEELAQLPENHPLKDSDGPLAGALEDGQITTEELREAFRGLGPGPTPRFLGRLGLGLRLGALLDDGVITQEEIDQLPEGSFLKDPNGPAAEYLDDGQLTLDELKELWQGRR